jgi:hypothetical protein
VSQRAIIVPETWRPITKYPGFEVSNHGGIKRLGYHDLRGRKQPERIIYSRVTDNRYAFIFPYGANQRIVINVARTVLEAFVGPEPFLGADARHLDDNSNNMMLENLAWGTRTENMQDALRNGRTPGKYVRTEEIRQKLSNSKRGRGINRKLKSEAKTLLGGASQ